MFHWKRTDKVAPNKTSFRQSLFSGVKLEPRIVLDGALAASDPTPSADSPVDPIAPPSPLDVGQNDSNAKSTSEVSRVAIEATPDDYIVGGGQANGTLVIVDTSVANYEQLLVGLEAGTDVVFLEQGSAAIEQISEILDRRENVSSLQIISHGAEGSLFLGGEEIREQDLLDQSNAIAAWANSLTGEADILLLGCDLAGNLAGQNFLNTLANLTGADVAASIDDTGASELGGDWALEYSVGEINTGLALSAQAQSSYAGLLAPPHPGGDVTVTSTSGQAVSVAEDSTASSANIRLTVPSLNDPDGPAPTQIRILSVDGGTLQQADGSAITVGSSGTLLTLSGSSLNFRFTPDANRDTNASFTYGVVDSSDSNINSAASTATITIEAANDAPSVSGPATLNDVAEDSSAGSIPGTTVTNLIATFTYAEVDTADLTAGIAVVGTTGDQDGTWQFSTNGGSSWIDLGTRSDSDALLLDAAAGNLLRFVPNADFTGTATLTLRGWDGTTGASGTSTTIASSGGATAFSSGTVTATQTVTNVNDAPVLTSGVVLADIEEDVADGVNNGTQVSDLATAADAAVLAEDVDGDAIGIAISGITGDGTWQYSSDGSSWTDITAPASNAVLLVDASSFIRFVPTLDVAGEATISYHAWDASTGSEGDTVDLSVGGATGGVTAFSSASATSTLGVTPVNDDPIVGANSATLLETATLTLTATELGATDVDNDPDQLVYEVTSAPSEGVFTRTYGPLDIALQPGSLFTQADVASGLIKYRYTGSDLTSDTTDTVVLTLRDGAGAELTNQTLTFTVQDVNAAISVGGTTISVNERIGAESTDFATLNLSASDADASPSDIMFTIDTLPSATVGRLQIDTGSGFVDAQASDTITQAQINAGGLRFIHTGIEPTGANESTSFTVSVTDSNATLTPSTASGIVVTLDVIPVNDTPQLDAGASAGPFVAVEGTNTTITSAVNAVGGTIYLEYADPDSARDRVVYTITNQPSVGQLVLDGTLIGTGATFTQADVDAGNLVYKHDGSEPNGTSVADDSFTYVMRDGDGASVTATLDIDVTPANDPAIVDPGRLYVMFGNNRGVSTVHLEATDPDTTDPNLIYTIDAGTLPPNGVFQRSGNTVTSFSQQDINDGLITFVHSGPIDDVGGYPVGFSVSDGTSTTGGNILPVIIYGNGGIGSAESAAAIENNDAEVVFEAQTGSVITSSDLRADDEQGAPANITFTVDTAPLNGTLYRNGVALSASDTFTQADINAGLITYDHDGSETTSDSFAFTLSNTASTITSTGVFDFIVTPVNDAPTITQSVTDVALTEEDTNAADDSDDFTLSDVSNAIKLTLTNLGDGDVDTTALQNRTYVITDSPDGGTIRKWTGSAWSTLGNDGRFTAQDIVDGNVAYFHNPNSEPNAPTDYVEVRLTDGGSNPDGSETTSGTSRVNFLVANVNDEPVSANRTANLAEAGTFVLTTGQISVTDSDDVSGDWTYRIVSLPSAGTLEIDSGAGFVALQGADLGTSAAEFTAAMLAAGDVRYVHDGTETFTDSLTYSTSDDEPSTGNTATLNFSIAPVNDLPTVDQNNGLTAAAAFEGEENTITAAMLGISDNDNTANQVQIRLTSAPTHGQIAIVNGGTTTVLGVGSAFKLADLNAGLVKYTHDNTENHTDSFNFAVSDGGGGAEPTGTFNITVAAVNDSPELTAPNSIATNEDAAVTITSLQVADIDVDQGGNALVLTLSVTNGTLSLPASGLVSGDGTGTLTVTGAPAAINALLASGLTYTPDAGFSTDPATENLVITLSDQGSQGRDPGDGANPAIINTDDTGSSTTQEASATIAITVKAFNDAPAHTLPSAPTLNEDTSFTFTGGSVFTIADVDVDGGNVTTTVSVENGTLAAAADGAATVSGGGTTTLTITGTLADVTSTLDGMVYTPDQHFNGADTLTLSTNDLGGTGAGGAKVTTDTLAINVTPINDAPSITSIPTDIQTAEDTPVTFSGGNLIALEDVDSEGALQVILTATNITDRGPSSAVGVITLATTTGLTVTGNGTGVVTLEGDTAQINAALSGATFAPADNDYGVYNINVAVDDQGAGHSSGSGPSLTADADIRVVVTSVNDTPTVALNSDLDANASNNAGLVVLTEGDGFTDVRTSGGTALTVADLDLDEVTSGNTLTVTLELQGTDAGELRFDGGLTGGVSEDAITGTSASAGFTSITITGTPTDLNTTLAELEYQPGTDFNTQFGTNQTADLVITVDDGDNSAPSVDGNPGQTNPSDTTRTLPITVTAVNDAPVLTWGNTNAINFADAVNEGAAVALPGFTIADIDTARGEGAQGNPLQVTIAGPAGGSLSITTGQGTSFTSGSSNGDSTLVIVGTAAELDAALAGLTFTPGDDTATSADITVTLSDRGNRGTGGTLTDSTTLSFINIVPANDAPVITRPAAVTATEDVAFVFENANLVSIADVDIRANDAVVTLSVPVGTLTLSQTTGLTFLNSTTNGSGSLEISGSLANINAALDGLSYSAGSHANNENIPGTVTLTIGVDDQGFGLDNAAGGALTDTQTVTIDVQPVNDAPALTVPANASVSENVPFTFSGIALADVDAVDSSAGDMQLVLSVTNGTLDFVNPGLSAATVTNSGTQSVTITGTLAELNALIADGNLRYTSVTDFSGVDTLSYAFSDQGNVGSGGTLSDSASTALTISGDNDLPVFSAPTSVSVVEDGAVTLDNANTISFLDPDLGGSDVMVRITADKGTVTLAQTSGLDFGFSETSNPFSADGGTTSGQGDGTGDAVITVKGSLPDVLAALDGLVFTPTADVNGAGSITVLVSDLGSTGTGGANEVSQVVTVNITPVNDAPTASGNQQLSAVAEDASDPAGASVSSLVTGSFADATDQVSGGSNADTLFGIAITGNAATVGEGVWEYSTDGGSNWSSLPSVASNNALVIEAAHLLRFVPAADYNGSPGALDLHLIDSSASGLSSGDQIDLTTGGATGGTSAVSTATIALGTTITAVNDAPIASGASDIAAVNEDAAPTQVLISSQFAANFSDTADTVSGGSTANTLEGIAIVADASTPSQGTWQYQLDGSGSWVDITGVSAANALILPADASLRFLPTTHYAGPVGALSIALVDNSSGAITAPGSADLSGPGARGEDTPYSAGTVSFDTSLTPVADAPGLSPVAASGNEDTAIALVINPTLVDTDGSESLTVTISSLPAGASLANTAGDTLTIAGGSITLTPAQLAGLTVTPPADSDQNFTLNIAATATDSNNDTATTNDTLTVMVTAVADTPTLSVNPASGTEDTTIALLISPGLTDTDGSETLSIEISGIPASAALTNSAGDTIVISGGSATLTPAQLAGLAITAPQHSDANFDLTITATATDTGGDTAMTVATLPISVTAAADAPALAVSNAIGDEDSPIGLSISPSLVDTDGSETLSIVISNIPAGAVLTNTAGDTLTVSGGQITLAPGQLAGLAITPQAGDDSDFTLSIEAIAADTGGVTSSTTDTLGVTVNAVAGAPTLTANDVSGNEDTAIILGIAAAASDPDGSETISIDISGIPTGASLTNTAGDTLTQAGGVLTLSQAQLAGLALTPPADSDSDIALTITATATDNGGDTATRAGAMTVSINAVADTPTLSVSDSVALEDQPAAVQISAALADTDGSESLTVALSGIPAGATLANTAGDTLTVSNGEITLTPAQLIGLTITPPLHDSSDIPLAVTATATDTGGVTAQTSDTLTVRFTPVADAPGLSTTDASGDEDAAIPLIINPALLDTDGSESLMVTMSGLPAGASLANTAGDALTISGGSITLSAPQLVGLTVTPPADSDQNFTLNIAATATDSNNDTATTNDTLTVLVTAVADTPALTVNPASGTEDTAIALAISPSLLDTDASETLSIDVSGIPAGAVLTNSADDTITITSGTATLAPAQLAGLALTPPQHSDANFDLTITVTVTDTGGDTATTVATLPASITAVADAPMLAVSNAAGDENSPISLSITPGLVDTDGSETLSIIISNIPAGAVLTNTAADTLTVSGGQITLTSSQLTGLAITPQVSDDSDFTLSIEAIATDTGGVTASTTQTLGVIVNAVAGTPILTVADVSGSEDSAILLGVDVAASDPDGSETLSIDISGLPAGAALTNTAGDTIIIAGGTAMLTPGQLAGLTLTPPLNSADAIPLTITVTATDNGGDTSTRIGSMTVNIAAIADVPVLAVSDSAGLEDQPAPLNISSSLVDTDGSEQLSITLSGIPQGASLSNTAGDTFLVSGGSVALSPSQLASLAITPPLHDASDIVLNVTATATETGAGTAQTTDTLTVAFTAIADAPALMMSAATGAEDQSIPLSIAPALVDLDGSETLSIDISGIPAGAVLTNAAGDTFTAVNGSATLIPTQLVGLAITPPADSDSAFTLSVLATTTDVGGSTASAVGTIDVTISAIADTPSLSATAVPALEDMGVPLTISAALADTDGSESLSLRIEDVPAGATFTNAAGETLLVNDGALTLTPGQLAGLTLHPVANSDVDFTLTIVAAALEQTGALAETSVSLPISIEAVADAPTLSTVAASGDEDTAIPLEIAADLTDLDGSETLTITIDDIPAGSQLTNAAGDALDVDAGSATLTAGQLAGLALTPPANLSGDFVLTVTAEATDTGGVTSAVTQTLDLTIAAVADVPTLDVLPTVGSEDITIPITINSELLDVDGSETLTIRLEGIPAGATLANTAGDTLTVSNSAITLTPGQLAGLTITPLLHDSSDISLSVTAIAIDTGGVTAQTSDTVTLRFTPVADAPGLAVSDAAVNEDASIPLVINPALVDTDGSESLTVTISSLPAGASLTNTAGDTLTIAGGSITLTAAQLAGLAITPPADSDQNFTLNIAATATDSNNDTATSNDTLTVVVTAVADTPTLTVNPASGTEDTAIALAISPNLTDTDSSETLSIDISGIPAGAVLTNSAGDTIVISSGSATLTPAQLTGLAITAPQHSDTNFDLTITATATDTGGDTAMTVATLPVSVTAAADAPTLAVSNAIGDEDSPIGLSITPSLVDTDGSETLSIVISNIPAGAVLTNTAGDVLSVQDGSATLTAGQLAGLTLTPPRNVSGDVVLSVTATATDTGGITSATTQSLDLRILPIADLPTLEVDPASGDEGLPIALDIAAAIGDDDGSEQLTIILSDIPDGSILTNAAGDALTITSGQATLLPSELPGLAIQPPFGQLDFDLTVTAQTTDGSNITSRVVTLPIAVSAEIPPPPIFDTPAQQPPSVQAPVPVAPGPAPTTGGSDGGGDGPGGEPLALTTTRPVVAGSSSLFSSDPANDQGVENNAGQNRGDTVLRLVGSVDEQVLVTNTTKVFQVPKTVFEHNNPDEALSFEAKLSSGQPLPGWLIFDAGSLQFTGTPPDGQDGLYEIKVTARDSDGNEADAIVRIRILQDVEGVAEVAGSENADEASEDSADGEKPARRFSDQLRDTGPAARFQKARALIDAAKAAPAQ